MRKLTVEEVEMAFLIEAARASSRIKHLTEAVFKDRKTSMKCPNCGSDKFLPGISESGRYSYCTNCTHTEKHYASYFQRQKGARKNERALRRKERKRGVLLYDKLREASRSRGEDEK